MSQARKPTATVRRTPDPCPPPSPVLPSRCCAPFVSPAHASLLPARCTRALPPPVVASEDLCQYRYQFDNRIELTATWDAADGNGLEGQVSVTQVSGGGGGSGNLDDGAVAKLQISVFLTAASRCHVLFVSSPSNSSFFFIERPVW